MKIYLGDLSHYTIKLQNNTTPLSIGYIGAYLDHYLKDKVQVKLFKGPEKLLEALEREVPDVLGMSNYMWSQSASELMFRKFKELNPKGVTIFGGPNFPNNEPEKAQHFLRSKPFIDFFIPYEGEIPALDIVRALLESHKDLDYLKKNEPERFDGSHFIGKDGKFIGNNIGVRTEDLSAIPSPYLGGWMDEFLKEGLHPLVETQRGCPFTCTFCDWGSKTYNKIRNYPVERVEAEIEHIIKTVKDPTQASLNLADANFGMWSQDLEFAKWLRNVYEKTGFPMSMFANTGKARGDLVLETVLTSPKLALGNSVQSLDDKVLKSIKRKNFTIAELKHNQTEITKVPGKMSDPECILGLPDETRESHLNTLRKLTNEIGAYIVIQHTFMLLPGAEACTAESRAKHQYNSKFRIIPTQFGQYAGEKCFEIEEISAGTKSMSFEEYLEMRIMYFLIHNIHSNSIFNSITRYIHLLGGDIIDFMLFIADHRFTLPEDSFPRHVIEAFLTDTKTELFDSPEELREHYNKEENYQLLLAGKKGINLTHTYRTRVFLNSKKWAAWVTEAFFEYMNQKFDKNVVNQELVESIITHVTVQSECQNQFLKDPKTIPSKKSPIEVDLAYDVPSIFATRIEKTDSVALEPTPKRYSYFMKDDAIAYVAAVPRKGIVDLAVTVLRMDQSYLFPVCVSSPSLTSV